MVCFFGSVFRKPALYPCSGVPDKGFISVGKMNETKKNEFNPIPAAKAKGLLATKAINNVAITAAIIPPTKQAFQIPSNPGKGISFYQVLILP